MDEKTKKLLGSATVAVASFGLGSLPGGAVSPDEPVPLLGTSAATISNRGTDLLVELMLRTGGSQSPEAISRELRLMLSYMAPERLAQLPTLVRDLRSLGLSEEAQDVIFSSLIDKLATMDLPSDEVLIEQLAEALVSEPERAFLADPRPSEQGRVPDQGGSRGVGLYEG